MPKFSVYALAKSMVQQHGMNVPDAFAVAWYAQKEELPLADVPTSKIVAARIKSVVNYPVLDADYVAGFITAYRAAIEEKAFE